MGLFIGFVYWFQRYIALCLLSLGNSDWIVFYSSSNKRNPIYSCKNILFIFFFYNLASNTNRCVCGIYCINYYSYSQSLRLKITTNKICILIEHSSATHFCVYTTNVWQIELSRVIKQGRLFLKYIWYHVEYLVFKYLKVTPTHPVYSTCYCTTAIIVRAVSVFLLIEIKPYTRIHRNTVGYGLVWWTGNEILLPKN